MSFIDDIIARVAPSLNTRAASDSILPPSRTTSTSSISVGEALTLPAVYRAVSTIAITAKQMSLDVVRNDRVIDSPSFVKKPNISMPRSTFIEQTVVSLATNGNAYWEITRDSQGRVINLTPLNPLDMRVETNTRGNIIKYIYMGVDIMPENIKHITLLQVPGSPLGLGPIQAAQADLYGAASTRNYATQWFDNAGVPSGIISTDQPLNKDQVPEVKKAWNDTAGAKNGVAVLGNGFRFTPMYLKPEELQFLQVQQFSVTQIARLFGVPATLMLTSPDGSSMTYNNVGQEWLAFIRFSMLQYLLPIEDALSDFLPGNSRAKFNIEAILRADTLTRYQGHQLALGSGWMTVDEVREIEDLPPLGDQGGNNV
jgi:HK97 family phage portal protein